MKNNENYFEFIVVGAGLAGITAALEASKFGTVVLLTKTNLEIGNLFWAQGGIAAAIGDNDSVDSHIYDTLTAGRGLCNKMAVEILADEGVQRVNELIKLGMPFEWDNGEIVVGSGAGHSHNRVLYSKGDSTGREIINFYIDIVRKNKNIKVVENSVVYHLIVENKICSGVYVYDCKNKNSFSLFGSSIILATGGASAIYQQKTTPHSSIGEGISLAYNAGADVENMEFIQFHATAFASENSNTFLISEKVLGAGAYLLNHEMNRFMIENDEAAELADRDVIAKSLFTELKRYHMPNAYLDLRHLDREIIRNQFSNIYDEALKYGVDITADLIPVAPAAYYNLGGIKTGVWGETNIKSLYAVGEAASSGVHGANKLAGNSLLECLVFTKRAVEHAVMNKKENIPLATEMIDYSVNENRLSWFNKIKNQVAMIMMNNVGVVRIQEELNSAINKLSMLRENIPADENEYYANSAINIVNVALLITTSALIREESRGCHFRDDFTSEEEKKYTIIQNKFSGLKVTEIIDES